MAYVWPLFFPLVRRVTLFLLPVGAEGLENVPRTGAFILVSNHISWVDPFWLEFTLGRSIRWMAKRELFRTPVLGWFIRSLGCFPVNRGAVDRRALAHGLHALADGVPLGLFP